ncbi:MAG: hypothetical protein K6G48_01645 [Acholeplasmatales bacterium]|nr:hypothetical protein [Acholeplasmatales bacterium]
MTRLKWNFAIALVFVVLNLVLIPIAIAVDHDSVKFYLSLGLCILISFLLPVVQLILKKNWPVLLEVIICTQAYLGLSISSAFNMYDYWYNWDMVLHGAMGVEALIFGYYLLLLFGGRNLPFYAKAVFLIIFVFGIAAIWEMMEFIAGKIMNEDYQKVFDPREPDGVNDTMMDIIIAFVTASATILVFAIDNIFKGRLLKIVDKSLIDEKIEEKENV